MVTLSIDVMCDLLMQWFLLWNRSGAIRPQCRSRLCRCKEEHLLFGSYHDLFSELIRPPPPPHFVVYSCWVKHSLLQLCQLWSTRLLKRKICHLARRMKSAAEASSESEWDHGSILEMTKWYCILWKDVIERCCGYRFASCAFNPPPPLPWTKSLDIF